MLGVGGRLFSDNLDVRLTSSNDAVVRIDEPARYDEPGAIIGVGPGTANVRAVDRQTGELLAEVPITVAELTALRLDGMPPTLMAATPVDVTLESWVGTRESSGYHYYKVVLDGEPYDCWGEVPRYCNGPVFYEQLHLDGLSPGTHELVFESVDDGADFTRTLVVP